MFESYARLVIAIVIAISGTQVIGEGDVYEPSAECLRRLKGGVTSPAETYLWRVEGRPKPAYFFGTIHVPYTRVWRSIPSEVLSAFDSSDIFGFEMDLSNSSTIRAIQDCSLLPNQTTLDQIVPQRLYERLSRYIQHITDQINLYHPTDDMLIDNFFTFSNGDKVVRGWQQKRPGHMWAMIAAFSELQMKYLTDPAVDLHLTQMAKGMGKEILAVELPQEQCHVFNAMSNDQAIALINHTLSIEEAAIAKGLPLGQAMQTLVSKYKCLDIDASIKRDVVDKVDNTTAGIILEEVNEYLRSELYERRDKKLTDRVESYLKQKPNSQLFFAFGVGHFLGNDSVVDQLRMKGYNITRVRLSEFSYLPGSAAHLRFHKFQPWIAVVFAFGVRQLYILP